MLYYRISETNKQTCVSVENRAKIDLLCFIAQTRLVRQVNMRIRRGVRLG